MSVSRLESLPNEILVDIFEKYLNCVDILSTFAFQLNRRFDTLVIQCHRLRFDFIGCQKDDFRLCMGLFPAHLDKIEELALSEQNAPGQIHAFLSFYPSFGVFKRLRKLYFHVLGEAVDPVILENALFSLSNTTVDTLYIKILNTEISHFCPKIVRVIFGIKTLKKLSIVCDPSGMRWDTLNTISSNVQHLTLHGLRCAPQDLTHIFRCMSVLRCLDIDLNFPFYHLNHPSSSSAKDSIPRMLMLHTVILNINELNETSHSQLEPYIRCMPLLHRLEITARTVVVNFSNWETLLQTSSSTLTYFTLESNTFRLFDGYVDSILASIETPFWMEKENFNIFVNGRARSNTDRVEVMLRPSSARDRFREPVAQWWIAPRRKLPGNLHVTNRISHLHLSAESSSVWNHYLDNVTHLIVAALNDNLFQLVTVHVNCSRIKHLDISSIRHKNEHISLLLQRTTNITSLQINLDQLYDQRLSYLREYHTIKFLDISASSHSFDERTIASIVTIFPHLEHLTVNAQDLRNVPSLWTYLSHLRSFTFSRVGFTNSFSSFGDSGKQSGDTIRKRTELLFQREGNYLTVWIDRATLEDCFWQSISKTDGSPSQTSQASWQRTTTTSTNQSWPRKTLRRIFRFAANHICMN